MKLLLAFISVVASCREVVALSNHAWFYTPCKHCVTAHAKLETSCDPLLVLSTVQGGYSAGSSFVNEELQL